MIRETERLVLRPWQEEDAAALYELARDERVGAPAGWPAHKSVGESAEIIRTVFALAGVFALVLKERDKLAGCAGLLTGKASNFPIGDDEGEISYWLGVPFWGRGLAPEAVKSLIAYGFEDLGLKTLWCGYYDGNERSRHVQEKCGFCYHHTEKDKFCPLTQDIRTEHISRLTREEWHSGQGGER